MAKESFLLFESSQQRESLLCKHISLSSIAWLSYVQVQGRAFLEAKHASSLAQLTKALEAESWSAAPVPLESQAVIGNILSRANAKPVPDEAHPSNGHVNGEHALQPNRNICHFIPLIIGLLELVRIAFRAAELISIRLPAL